jgi:PAS domain-containing protein
MLDEVEARARTSAAANAALQAEIEVRQAAEAALSIANARLDSTLAASEIGSWIWDLRADEFTADRNLAVLFGRQDERELSGKLDLHRSQIRADLESVRAADVVALRTGVLPSTAFRVLLSNGTERWVARRGKVQLDADGNPYLISGLLMDMRPKHWRRRPSVKQIGARMNSWQPWRMNFGILLPRFVTPSDCSRPKPRTQSNSNGPAR